MRPVLVVMGAIVGQDMFEMAATNDQHPVEALATNRADESLCKGICSGCSRRSTDGPDALGTEYFVEAQGELGVSVPDEELDGMSTGGQTHAQVCGPVGRPTPRSGVP